MSHLVLFNYEIFNLMLHCVCVCVYVRACCQSSPCTAGVQWLLIVSNLQPNSKWKTNNSSWFEKKLWLLNSHVCLSCSLHEEMSTNHLLLLITVLQLLVNKILIQIWYVLSFKDCNTLHEDKNFDFLCCTLKVVMWLVKMIKKWY